MERLQWFIFTYTRCPRKEDTACHARSYAFNFRDKVCYQGMHDTGFIKTRECWFLGGCIKECDQHVWVISCANRNQDSTIQGCLVLLTMMVVWVEDIICQGKVNRIILSQANSSPPGSISGTMTKYIRALVLYLISWELFTYHLEKKTSNCHHDNGGRLEKW